MIHAARVEFSFEVPEADGNPLAREVCASVTKPSGAVVRAPAYFVNGDRFAVRIFGDEHGRYQLVSVDEVREENPVAHPLAAVEPAWFDVETPLRMPFVRIDPGNPRAFSFDNDTPFVPIGGNIPWAPAASEVTEYYQKRFQQFSESGLNWARVWMSHWGGLNLDWPADENAEPPAPGWLDSTVAGNWDRLISMAEDVGVYVQVVLQYHGQFSTETNPKWDENPWNAHRSGGFLARPAEFFTSPRARRLTKQKYRYIVARWGYSPSVMSWELFNEVHWVDAIRQESDEAAVASWHDEMARFLRSVDVHRHLVTTSTDDIRSSVFEMMDFLQPHMYAVNMLDNMRYIDPVAAGIEKPIFFGEFGDDHMGLSPGQKQAAVAVVPPMWAGIMGELPLPPQPWFVDQLIASGNVGHLAALAQFLAATKIAERTDLVPFSPAVQGAARCPFVVEPGFVWMNRPDPVIALAVDGSTPVELALVPGVLVGDARGLGMGFPGRVTFRVDFPRKAAGAIRLRLKEGAIFGATAEVLVDGINVADHVWPSQVSPTQQTLPADLAFEVPAGAHVIELRNAGGPDWFHFDGWRTGFEVPKIGAVGRRGDRFVALWLWHRDNLFDLTPADDAAATVLIHDMPAGAWQAEWWDTERGMPVHQESIDHAGGNFHLDTPAIRRHAAVVLTR